MTTNLTIFVATSLLLLLCFNIFLRFRVFKVYNRLARNRVNFSPKQMMDPKLLESEVIPHYPQHADDIRSFSKNIRISIWVGIALLMVILFLGWSLIKNR